MVPFGFSLDLSEKTGPDLWREGGLPARMACAALRLTISARRYPQDLVNRVTRDQRVVAGTAAAAFNSSAVLGRSMKGFCGCRGPKACGILYQCGQASPAPTPAKFGQLDRRPLRGAAGLPEQAKNCLKLEADRTLEQLDNPRRVYYEECRKIGPGGAPTDGSLTEGSETTRLQISWMDSASETVSKRV